MLEEANVQRELVQAGSVQVSPKRSCTERIFARVAADASSSGELSSLFLLAMAAEDTSDQ